MEHQQQHHSQNLGFNSVRANAKLPPHLPPPSCSSSTSSSPTPGGNKFTTIERKSIVRMTSNGPIDDSGPEDCFVRRSSSNVRRNFQSQPQNSHIQDIEFFDFGSSSHITQLLDRLDSLSLSNLSQISSKPFSQRTQWLGTSVSHSPVLNNSTSGYDSNSSSSLLSGYFYPLGSSCASTSNATIRRIPSVPNLRSSSVASSSDSSSYQAATMKHSGIYNNKKARPNSMHVENQSLKDDVIRATDKIEKRVAFLREVANELLSERNKLQNAIQQVQQCCKNSHFTEVEIEEISAAVGLLQRRLETVNIEIRTPRSSEQTEALNKANKYVDELRELVKNKQNKIHTILSNKPIIDNELPINLRFAKQRCLSYISSCSSDGVPETSATPIDEKFQRTVIECTAEDQKHIRRALEEILVQLNQNEKS